jgi:threonine/homoserine/homoserine lactone efflux protein
MIMPELLPTLFSALTGFTSGFVLSMPVGPVNLTIINGAAQRGFKYAALIGLGAATMDAIYCTMAFTGFSSFFDVRLIKTSMEVFTSIFMFFLGAKFLMARTVMAPTQLGKTASRIEQRIDEKLHPHSAFMTGFVRVLGNLGVLLFWVVLAVHFMSHEVYFTTYAWVDDSPAGKFACIAGVALGANTWFCSLSYFVSHHGYGRISEHTLLRMEHFSGLCLIAIGLFDGANIAWKLAQFKH